MKIANLDESTLPLIPVGIDMIKSTFVFYSGAARHGKIYGKILIDNQVDL